VFVSEEGSKFYEILYGVDEERRKSIYQENDITKEIRYYFGNYEEKIDSKTGVTEKIHYLRGAIYITRSLSGAEGGSGTMYYVYADLLGSLTALVKEDGTVAERYAYDPWGVRRAPGYWAVSDARSELLVNRGYTGHEMLDWFGIINMNGRVYDPMTAMFFSPDPFVQAPGNWLNYNRYGYVYGNPFRYTDPSGEFVFSLFLGPVGVILDAACWGAVIGMASYTAGVAMSNGGFKNWEWGQMWKSVGIGALSGAATAGIGEIFGATGAFTTNIGADIAREVGRGVSHGLVQGGASALGGGDFWTGFASGALGSWVGHGASALGITNTVGGTLAFSTVSGGIGSWATGGSFIQGAASGLMVGLLNQGQHDFEEQKLKWAYSRKNGVIIAGVVIEGPDGVGGLLGEGHSDPANAQSNKTFQPIAEAVALANPLTGTINSAKSLLTGQDIFGNPVQPLDAVVSTFDVITRGAGSGIVMKVPSYIYKGMDYINDGLNYLYTIPKTIYTGYQGK
jgi:RHS repeat-associated protein